MRRFSVLALALAWVAWPASALGAEREIAVQPRETTVRAYAGIALFSRWDGSAYSLVISRAGGAPEALPVPAQSAPFDADIGPDSAGRPTVVLSRCASGDCDLYRLRIGTSTLQALRSTDDPALREVRPSLWHGDVVFVRRGARSASRQRLFLRHLGAPRSVSLPGIPTDGDVQELELYGRHVALSTVGDVPGGGGVCGQREVRLVDVRSRRVQVVGSQTCGLNGQSWAGPSFAAGALYFARYCGEEGSCGPKRYGAYRLGLRSGAYALASFARNLSGWATDGDGSAYEVRDPSHQCWNTEADVAPCRVVLVSGLQFSPARPPR
jgi:hypothetical protein